MAISPLRRSLAAGAASLALGLTLVSPVAAEPRDRRPPRTAPTVQEYYWHWSDSRIYSARTFLHTEFPSQASLPDLLVMVVPPTPRRMVYLEFYQDGRWAAENIVRTDGRGVATIDVDPYCANNTWCNGTYTYRLKIGDLTAPVNITYFER